MERWTFCGCSLRDVFLGLYIVAIPFHRSVWRLPFFGDRIQPAEFFLGILALVALALVLSGRIRYRFSPLDIPAFLWLAANVISNAMAGFSGRLLLETAKVAAVVLVYLIFRLLLSDGFLRKLPDVFLLSALIASLLAILGSVLSACGIQTALAELMQTYPYIGKIGRAMAFTSTPNMLGSFLMTALLLKAAQWLDGQALKRGEIMAVGLCLLAFVAAVTKTVLCFLLGLIVLALLAAKGRSSLFKTAAGVAALLLVIMYLVGSHFVFTPALTPRVLANMQQGHVTRAYHELGPLLAVETSYMTIKRSSLQVLKENFPWGVGTRNFKQQVPQLKEKGIYNKETKAFDPHCTPLGTLTELGLLGGLALVVLFIQICRGLLSVQRKQFFRFRHIHMGLTAIFVALSLEGWVTDIMNFRHYWLLLGVLAYMSHQASAPAAEPAD